MVKTYQEQLDEIEETLRAYAALETLEGRSAADEWLSVVSERLNRIVVTATVEVRRRHAPNWPTGAEIAERLLRGVSLLRWFPAGDPYLMLLLAAYRGEPQTPAWPKEEA